MPLSRAMSERGFIGEMDVRHHRGLGDARIGDDRVSCPGFCVQPVAEDGVVVGDVRADQQDHVGRLHVGVGAGRAIGAEAKLVAGDGARHAERRVAVVVASAEAKLHELAERVELFGEQSARCR